MLPPFEFSLAVLCPPDELLVLERGFRGHMGEFAVVPLLSVEGVARAGDEFRLVHAM